MVSYTTLETTEITNQCVLVCDLRMWAGADSACWLSVKGTQNEIGSFLANIFTLAQIERIDDFGGVCKTFLCEGEEYLVSPPKTKPKAAIFSFTPKKRVYAEGLEMARVAHASGFEFLILTLQKHDKYGKVWVLSAALNQINKTLTYYEDTNSVVDELKTSTEQNKVIAVHVIAPGFEQYQSKLADSVVSQQEYQNEVIAN
jgi:hypothetical protein